jgi:mitochondrial ATPase complex subunit ATP10
MVSRTTRDGRVQTRYTELVHGYFWMLKDLRRTQEKPVLANTDALIPSSLAQILPDLPRVQPLLLDTTTNAATHSGGTVDFPAHLLRQNRSRDPSAQCTLLAIAFRDFGFQQLASWIVPFSDAYAHNDRVQVATLLVSEGWLNRMLLRPVIVASTRRNTPPEQRSRTYLHFGSSPHVEEWRDALRLHNVLVGYVLLLDGLGRVRFAASGTATETELAALMQGARDLLVSPTETNSPRTTVGNRSAPRTSSSFRIAQTRRPVRR